MDTEYQIEIFQYNSYGVPSKPFPVKLMVDEDRIVPLVGEATVLGEYDILAMSFRPSPTLRSYGTLLKFETFSESEMKLSIALYARVLRGWRQLMGALAVAAGIGLASLPSILPQGTITGGWGWVLVSVTALLGFIGFLWATTKD